MTIPSDQSRRPGPHHLRRRLFLAPFGDKPKREEEADEAPSLFGAPTYDDVASASFSSLSRPEEKSDAPAAENKAPELPPMRIRTADLGSLSFEGLARRAQRQKSALEERSSSPVATGSDAAGSKAAETSFTGLSSGDETQAEKTDKQLDEYVAISKKAESKSAPKPRTGAEKVFGDAVGGVSTLFALFEENPGLSQAVNALPPIKALGAIGDALRAKAEKLGPAFKPTAAASDTQADAPFVWPQDNADSAKRVKNAFWADREAEDSGRRRRADLTGDPALLQQRVAEAQAEVDAERAEARAKAKAEAEALAQAKTEEKSRSASSDFWLSEADRLNRDHSHPLGDENGAGEAHLAQGGVRPAPRPAPHSPAAPPQGRGAGRGSDAGRPRAPGSGPNVDPTAEHGVPPLRPSIDPDAALDPWWREDGEPVPDPLPHSFYGSGWERRAPGLPQGAPPHWRKPPAALLPAARSDGYTGGDNDLYFQESDALGELRDLTVELNRVEDQIRLRIPDYGAAAVAPSKRVPQAASIERAYLKAELDEARRLRDRLNLDALDAAVKAAKPPEPEIHHGWILTEETTAEEILANPNLSGELQQHLLSMLAKRDGAAGGRTRNAGAMEQAWRHEEAIRNLRRRARLGTLPPEEAARRIVELVALSEAAARRAVENGAPEIVSFRRYETPEQIDARLSAAGVEKVDRDELRRAIEENVKDELKGNIGRYDDVKGHHVHMVVIFTPAPGSRRKRLFVGRYHEDDGLAVAEDFLKRFGGPNAHALLHDDLRELHAIVQNDLRERGVAETLPLRIHNELLIWSLERQGVPKDLAYAILRHSLRNLRLQGVDISPEARYRFERARSK